MEGYAENELTQTSCLSPGEPCWARIGTGNFQGQSLKDDQDRSFTEFKNMSLHIYNLEL